MIGKYKTLSLVAKENRAPINDEFHILHVDKVSEPIVYRTTCYEGTYPCKAKFKASTTRFIYVSKFIFTSGE